MIFSDVVSYPVDNGGIGLQGADTDGARVYLTVDRSGSVPPLSGLRNSILVYDLATGAHVATYAGHYTGTDAQGKLMNFVSCTYNVEDNSLYVNLTNFHSLGMVAETAAAVVRFSLPDMVFRQRWDIAPSAGSNEGQVFGHGSWWVCNSASAVIRRYSADWAQLLGTYSVPKTQPLDPNSGEIAGYWQQLLWRGPLLYSNLHGPNTMGGVYSKGLEVSYFDGKTFTHVETVVPPTFGSGQGFGRRGNTWVFADRPSNSWVRCTGAEAPRLTDSTKKAAAARDWHQLVSRERIPVAVTKSELRTGIEALDSAGAHNLQLLARASELMLSAIYRA